MFSLVLKFVYIYVHVRLFFPWSEWASSMLDVYYVDKPDDGFVG